MDSTRKIPRLVATSVVRGNLKHDSQGGVFLIDLEQQQVNLALDWNTAEIDWLGRGFDLGLRAIAFDGKVVYLAASDELFAYTPEFELIARWRNPYLKHCRAMAVHQRKLFLSSAAFDCVLAFDLDTQAFDWAMHIGMKRDQFSASPFDPNGDEGPLPLNKLELTDLFCNADGMYISGLNSGGMVHFNGESILMSVTLPPGSRNARPFRNGALFIDNETHAVRYSGRENQKEDRALALPAPDPAKLLNVETDFSGQAGVGFGNGLCVIKERFVAVGSSPSTITLYDLQENRRMFSANLSRDVRTAIHGLAIWPY